MDDSVLDGIYRGACNWLAGWLVWLPGTIFRASNKSTALKSKSLVTLVLGCWSVDCRVNNDGTVGYQFRLAAVDRCHKKTSNQSVSVHDVVQLLPVASINCTKEDEEAENLAFFVSWIALLCLGPSLPLFVCDCWVLCPFSSGIVFLYVCQMMQFCLWKKKKKKKKKHLT